MYIYVQICKVKKKNQSGLFHIVFELILFLIFIIIML